MLDHVYITASDIVAAERFYDAVMDALGVVKVGSGADWIGCGERADADHPERIFIPIRKGPAPHQAYACHWCFKARSRTLVDAFWAAGLASGGSDDGAPGLRHYHASYCAAFLRDPGGNRIEAVCHHAV